MTDDLDVAIRHVRNVALWHPTLIRRAPIGMYYLYMPSAHRHVRPLRGPAHPVAGVGPGRLDDYVVWVPARGDDWATVLLWSPYMAAPGQPQVFIPGDWIPYLRALATCRSRQLLDWRAAHWIPSRVTGSGAGDGRQPAERPAVPRQGRRVPARVGDHMRTIDQIDLALTAISSMTSPKSGVKHEIEN